MTLTITPNAKQKLFLEADVKHIGFGGARGGGKSWAVRTKATLLALHYAGIKILIVRRTYPELIANHISILVPQVYGVARYNKSEKELTFMNGSRVKFGYCANDSDLLQYQGAEYDAIFLDEATQLTEIQMKTLTACLRGVNAFPKRIYYTCNPGGAGHSYIKRIFIDKQYEAGENPQDYAFIQSLVTDNIALMESQPDYIKQLEALPYKLREAWLHGKWDVFEGQFFEEFTDDPEHYEDRRHTHVIAPFIIPDDWTVYRSFDWGYAKPFSCHWYAIDRDGVIYAIAEYYGIGREANEGAKMTPQEVFSRIHTIETEHPLLTGKKIRGVADPAIWQADTGESIAETAGKHGIFFQPGDNKRIPGWMQVHYRLTFDENGYPMLYFFKTCKHLIRTLPLMMYDERSTEDLDTNLEDHAADELRYMCMSRPIKPVAKTKSTGYESDPRNIYLDVDEDELYKLTSRPRMEIKRGDK